MKMLYLDDYKNDEEAVLKGLGVECARMSLARALEEQGWRELDADGVYEVRGNRIDVAEYRRLHAMADNAGVCLGTSPKAFEIGAEFALQYALIGELSPKAIVVRVEESPGEIVRLLKQNNLQYPVFLRSEVESAAKYVGVDGCIVTSANESKVATVVENLRRNVRGFRCLIFKEMVEIQIDRSSGRRLEYRAIGVNGQCLLFDSDDSRSDGLPDPQSLGLGKFADGVFNSLAQGGADGALFVDLAVSREKSIVVECKNLFNGTVKSVRQFGECIARL